jgi:hypothetical protein
MKIGTIFAGEIDKINGECIVTKFLMIGLPIVPISSHYATSRQVNGLTGFEINLHPYSVLLGYLRYWCFALTLAFGGWAYFERQPSIYMLAAICLILFLLSMFWWGRLSKIEILRRTLYKKYTDIYANPDHLPRSVKTSAYESLTAQWAQLADATHPWTLSSTPWLACHQTIKTDLHHYGLAYTMGRYAGATEKMDVLWALVMASMAYEYRES